MTTSTPGTSIAWDSDARGLHSARQHGEDHDDDQFDLEMDDQEPVALFRDVTLDAHRSDAQVDFIDLYLTTFVKSIKSSKHVKRCILNQDKGCDDWMDRMPELKNVIAEWEAIIKANRYHIKPRSLSGLLYFIDAEHNLADRSAHRLEFRDVLARFAGRDAAWWDSREDELFRAFKSYVNFHVPKLYAAMVCFKNQSEYAASIDFKVDPETGNSALHDLVEQRSIAEISKRLDALLADFERPDVLVSYRNVESLLPLTIFERRFPPGTDSASAPIAVFRREIVQTLIKHGGIEPVGGKSSSPVLSLSRWPSDGGEPLTELTSSLGFDAGEIFRELDMLRGTGTTNLVDQRKKIALLIQDVYYIDKHLYAVSSLINNSKVHADLVKSISLDMYAGWTEDLNFGFIQEVKAKEEIGYSADLTGVMRALRNHGFEHRTWEMEQFLASKVGRNVADMVPRRRAFSAAATVLFLQRFPTLAKDMKQLRDRGRQLAGELGWGVLHKAVWEENLVVVEENAWDSAQYYKKDHGGPAVQKLFDSLDKTKLNHIDLSPGKKRMAIDYAEILHAEKPECVTRRRIFEVLSASSRKEAKGRVRALKRMCCFLSR